MTNFKEAITIGEILTKKAPSNREYKLELAKYYDNFAMLLLDDKRIDNAKQYNLQTLDLIEELAAPATSLSIELADVHNIRALILESQDPKEALENCKQSMEILEKLKVATDPGNRFAVEQKLRDLGYNYAELADRGLKLGSLTVAAVALNNLKVLLPDLSEQDRTALNKYYQQLHDKMTQNQR
jgi:hypothetical protein